MTLEYLTIHVSSDMIYLRVQSQQLMYVLEHREFEDIITWSFNGQTFIIKDPKTFTENVLPPLFKIAKFESFQRKLDRWGFAKRRGAGRIGLVSPETWWYYHPCFQKGNYDLCRRINCNSKKNNIATRRAISMRANDVAASLIPMTTTATASSPLFCSSKPSSSSNHQQYSSMIPVLDNYLRGDAVPPNAVSSINIIDDHTSFNNRNKFSTSIQIKTENRTNVSVPPPPHVVPHKNQNDTNAPSACNNKIKKDDFCITLRVDPPYHPLNRMGNFRHQDMATRTNHPLQQEQQQQYATTTSTIPHLKRARTDSTMTISALCNHLQPHQQDSNLPDRSSFLVEKQEDEGRTSNVDELLLVVQHQSSQQQRRQTRELLKQQLSSIAGGLGRGKMCSSSNVQEPNSDPHFFLAGGDLDTSTRTSMRRSSAATTETVLQDALMVLANDFAIFGRNA